jgi:hypothetical protein
MLGWRIELPTDRRPSYGSRSRRDSVICCHHDTAANPAMPPNSKRASLVPASNPDRA